MFQFFKRSVLFLVGFTIPIEYLSVDVGVLLTPVRAASLFLIGTCVLRMTLTGHRYPRDRLVPWVFLLALSVLVSGLWAYGNDIPIQSLGPHVLTWFSLFVMYMGLNYLVDDEKDLDRFILALSLGAVFVAATAAAGVGYQTESSEGARQGGYGGNVNQLGANLSIALPLVTALILVHRSMLLRIFLVASMAVHVAGIVGTLSRSTYVAVLAMGGFWLVRYARPGTALRLAIPATLLFAFLLAIAPASFYERLSTLAPGNQAADRSVQVRLRHQIPDALNMFASSPLIGVGLLRTVSWSLDQGTKYGNIIHNSFLQLAAEQGLLGLIPFLFVLVLAWRNLTFVIRRGRDPTAEDWLRGLAQRAIFIQVALMGVVMNSITHATQRDKGPWLVFALSTIVVSIYRRRTESSAIGRPADS
jgi:O-antigen ligase